MSRDFFRPTGIPITLHRAGRSLCSIDMSTELRQAELNDANIDVSFWVRNPGTGWAEDTTPFIDPNPEVHRAEVRFYVEPPIDALDKKRGVRADITLTDGRRLISDHYLEIRGSVS